MSSRSPQEIQRGLTLRKALAVFYWHYTQIRASAIYPGSVVEKVCISYYRFGNLSTSVTVKAPPGKIPGKILSSPSPQWLNTINASISRSFGQSFAGMLGTEELKEAPDEAMLDWAYRTLMPMLPPKEQLPKPVYWVVTNVPVTATRVLDVEASNPEEAAEKAGKKIREYNGYIGGFDTVLHMDQMTHPDVRIEKYEYPELI